MHEEYRVPNVMSLFSQIYAHLWQLKLIGIATLYKLTL